MSQNYLDDFQYYAKLIQQQLQTNLLLQQSLPIQSLPLHQSIPTRYIKITFKPAFQTLVLKAIGEEYEVREMMMLKKKGVYKIAFFSVCQAQRVYLMIQNYYSYGCESMEFFKQSMNFQEIDYVTIGRKVQYDLFTKVMQVFGKIYQTRELQMAVMLRFDDYRIVDIVKDVKEKLGTQKMEQIQNKFKLSRRDYAQMKMVFRNTFVYSKNCKNKDTISYIYNICTYELPNKIFTIATAKSIKKKSKSKSSYVSRQFNTSRDSIYQYQQAYDSHKTIIVSSYKNQKQVIQKEYLWKYNYSFIYNYPSCDTNSVIIIGFVDQREAQKLVSELKVKNIFSCWGCKRQGKINIINCLQRSLLRQKKKKKKDEYFLA